MNLAPSYGNFDGIIYGAYMDIIDGIVYWSDCECFDVSQIDCTPEYDEFTWISSEKAKWRIADEHIGNEEVYISKK